MNGELDIILHSYKTMKIYEKIRAVRQAKGYTQDYIADKLSIDTVNYGRIERGQAKLTIDRFELICKILDVSPQSFFSDKKSLQKKDELENIMNRIYTEVKQINNKLNFINYEDY